MTVELRHLRCFLAIAEEGGVTRAARRLHVGQPALSRTLRQLEAHLGVLLVDRSTHHLELTPAGQALLPRARAAVAAVEAALDPATLGDWPLRLGHAWSALGDHTTPLLRAWQRDHPDIPLELRRIEERTAGLAQGRVDAALLRGGTGSGMQGDAPVPGKGFHVELLRTEPRTAAVPADSPLAARESVTLADLATHPVAVNTGSGSTRPELWPPHARPVATLSVANTDDWLAAIAAGRAVGVSVESTARMHPYPGVVYRPLADAPGLPLLLVWPDPPTHPAVTALAALIRDVINSSADQGS
ncbi:LysR family transcriptional regulator [Streptomyces durbertensis]|nr:LysR family transcriptional regulator [Streptomyces durbertensis]